VALEVLRNLRKLGLFTVMGISNVSHGLPERSLLNKTFLTMAAGAGLDAVIANPLDDGFTPMMMACNLLAGRDEGALRYISWANSLRGKVEHIARQGQGDLLGPIEQMRRCIVQGDKAVFWKRQADFLQKEVTLLAS